MVSPNQTSLAKRRVGALLSTELLFVLPLLMFILLALVEYTFFLTAETRLAAASREGARVASMGGSTTAVNSAIEAILGATLLAKSTTTVTITYPNTTSNTGDPVTVTITVAATDLVPNYLKGVGFDLTSKTLTGKTTMILQ